MARAHGAIRWRYCALRPRRAWRTHPAPAALTAPPAFDLIQRKERLFVSVRFGLQFRRQAQLWDPSAG
jgi:hypothetical protein